MRGRSRSRSRVTNLPWTPASLSGLGVWLTAGPDWCFSDASGTVRCADGDGVRIWKDRSGNLADVTQATSGQRPVLRLVSGQWVVRFDGVDDTMSGTVSIASSFNAHVVAKRDPSSTLGDRTTISHANGGTDATLHLRSTSATTFRFGLFFDDLNAAVNNLTTARSQFSCTLDANRSQVLRQDGVEKGSRTANGSYSGGNAVFYVGSYFGGENWIGDICEIVIAGNQSVAQTESYLRSAWGTP